MTCWEKAWVSWGGEEKPWTWEYVSWLLVRTWLERPSGGVAVPSLKRELLSSGEMWVTGEGSCCLVSTGVLTESCCDRRSDRRGFLDESGSCSAGEPWHGEQAG